MKKTVLKLWTAVIMAGWLAVADGLIIIDDPGLVIPVPPLPRPEPHPPRRPFIPPPRPYTFAPLEVRYHRVEASVRDQVATTTVDQEFYNPNDRQLEGTFLFPVPRGAHIDRFSLVVDGRQLDAELLAAEKARQIYEDIVRKHRDPALLEYAGRDLFKVRIFPIEPRGSKRVKLSYTELLKTDFGVTRYLYPLNTEKFSAKPVAEVSIKLEVETAQPLKTIYSPSHSVDVRRHSQNRATVGFESKDVKPDTDFVVLFSVAEGEIGVSMLTHKTGPDDGYFLLFVTPAFEAQPIDIVSKDIAFVLDTSGSMAGKKLDQAKKAITYCIRSLQPTDRFEIIRFSTEPEPLFGRLEDASPASRERAEQFVQGLKAAGGTAIHDALKQALDAQPHHSQRPYYVIFLTDGLPTVGETDNDKIVSMVQSSKKTGVSPRVFCLGIGADVNTHLLDRITEATRASSTYVFPDEDIELKLSSFFSKISEPVLTNVKLQFPDAVKVSRLHPPSMPDLFKGDQLVVAGRYSGTGTGLVTLQGTVNNNLKSFQREVHFPDTAHEMGFIPRLWATRRIGYLLDEIRLRGENPELKEEVVDLARKYGIVTPYTAYLIHEDEQRRNVPLAMRLLPQIETDRQIQAVTRDVYQSYKADVTGGAALAAASYVSSQKGANQVDSAIHAGFREASRTIVFRAGAAPSKTQIQTSAAHGLETDDLLAALASHTRFVDGKTFFFNEGVWIDSQAVTCPTLPKVTIRFGSEAYFDLLARHPEAGPWLALGQQVRLVLKTTLYEINN